MWNIYHNYWKEAVDSRPSCHWNEGVETEPLQLLLVWGVAMCKWAAAQYVVLVGYEYDFGRFAVHWDVNSEQTCILLSSNSCLMFVICSVYSDLCLITCRWVIPVEHSEVSNLLKKLVSVYVYIWGVSVSISPPTNKFPWVIIMYMIN